MNNRVVFYFLYSDEVKMALDNNAFLYKEMPMSDGRGVRFNVLTTQGCCAVNVYSTPKKPKVVLQGAISEKVRQVIAEAEQLNLTGCDTGFLA